MRSAHRALDSAHPILAVTSRLTKQQSLADSEHFAILVLHAGRQLAVLLSDYAQAVTKENIDPDDDAPFGPCRARRLLVIRAGDVRDETPAPRIARPG